MNRIACLLVLLVPGVAAATDGWQHAVDDNALRRASVQGGVLMTAADGSTAAELAELELRCRPGRDGSLVWRLVVPAGGVMAVFPYDAFEGPDAPAAATSASRLALEGGLLRTAFDTRQSGYRLDAGRFAFEVVQPSNASGEAALLADAIGTQTRALTWSVRADGGFRLDARFDAAGARAAVAETMLGCGPVPVLGADERAALAGRAVADSGALASRALAWRLAATLGPRWPAVRERLAAATAGVDGDVFYLLADEGEDRGVAVLFGPHAATVVVLIDEGRVTRDVLDGASIPAPQPVREFVAARRRS
jgi:hypothetical protein